MDRACIVKEAKKACTGDWEVVSAACDDDLWTVVLADSKKQMFATMVVDPSGHVDVVCVERYTPARRT